MTAYHTTARGRALSSTLLAGAVGAVAQLARFLRNRRDFNRLSALTDAELKDIGLTRADIHLVATSAFGSDRTARLSDIVEARLGDY